MDFQFPLQHFQRQKQKIEQRKLPHEKLFLDLLCCQMDNKSKPFFQTLLPLHEQAVGNVNFALTEVNAREKAAQSEGGRRGRRKEKGETRKSDLL